MGLSLPELLNLLDGQTPTEPIVEQLIIAAYELENWRDWCAGGRPQTSFRLNAFPGDEPSCARLAVYGLLNPPDNEPISPKVRSWFDVGLDLEHHWVERIAAYGSLLSANVTAADDEQTRFEDKEHWSSGLVDVIVLPPHKRKAHVIEVKTSKDSNVQSILDEGKVPNAHAKYMRQLKSYIGYAHEQPFSPEVWVCKKSGRIPPLGLLQCSARMLPTDRPHPLLHDGECDLERVKIEPPDDGTLIYSSRDEPLKVASFNARYDPAFMSAGRAQLAIARDAFLSETIPAHPYAGQKKMWTADLCKWCKMKDPGGPGGCKMDFTNKITDLRESNVIGYIKSLRPAYDYDEQRARVLARWQPQPDTIAAQPREEQVSV